MLRILELTKELTHGDDLRRPRNHRGAAILASRPKLTAMN
jgi:hypothetical protein